ncbi:MULTISPECIES: hypothetical protein [unclassified Kribbella]|uniref:hypothetical protein n=1 Tax=unclassified Kribbella TaxID=2644121 RepID=UPI003077F118
MPGARSSKDKQTTPATPTVLGVAVRDDTWFRPAGNQAKLDPGRATSNLLKVPAGDGQRILRQTVRLVADIPRRASPDLVWVQGASELLVRTGGIGLTCLSGLITIALPVTCDQLKKDATVQIPLGVGTAKAPSGLIMSTLTRPVGPDLVIDVWSGALIAFAWEAVVHLAQQLCAAAGKDAAGSPLIPGYIAAERGVLLIQPMARHRI